MIVINIPGELRGKGRPRFTTASGKPRAFTDAKTQSAEAWVRLCASVAHTGAPLDGPVSLVMQLGVPVPRSWPKKRRADALAGATFPTVKPDLDNILKLVGDALNGVIWADDRQIVRALVSRHYAEIPSATLTVSEA